MLKTFHSFGRSFLVINALLLLSGSTTLAQTLPPPPTEDDGEVYQFSAPDHSSATPTPGNPASNTMFRVQVYGSSEQLLSLVRQVEPDAFIPEGKNIIQAGLFSEAVNAEELAQSLSQQGISADIIEVAQPQNLSSRTKHSSREFISLSNSSETNGSSPDPSEFIPLAVESVPSHLETQPQTETTRRGYYVVIPSREKNLSTTAQAVQAAGINQRLIQQRNAPRGTHVAVGPFSRRVEASRWSSQLQTEGLNARVYFGR